MDVLTQGLLGAAAAMAVVSPKPGRRVWLMGLAGGMAADIDFLFEAAPDPMLGIRYHRHFTHALAFVPVGTIVTALPFLARRRNRDDWRAVVGSVGLGYATHGLLDWLTGYGTVLLWPFSEARLALDWIAIVDPVVPMILAIGMLVAGRIRRRVPARAALMLVLGYFGFGGIQHHRAQSVVVRRAESRGHAVERMRALPLVLSNRRWRTFYEFEGIAHVYDVTVPWFAEPRAIEGPSYEILREPALTERERSDPRTVEAFQRYVWFTDGWIARVPEDPSLLGDMRYAPRQGESKPMWAIRLQPGNDRPVTLVQNNPKVRDLLERRTGAGETPTD